jgi:hypothetical protein
MKIEEIKALIESNKGKGHVLPLSELMTLKSIANVTLEINRENGDYFYQVELNDLVDKEFDTELITEYAWEISQDGKKIILLI